MLEFCPRCDRGSCSDGPWCRACQKTSADEYRAVYREWFRRNSERLLREMDVPLLYRVSSFQDFATETGNQHRALNAVKAWLRDDSQGIFLCGPPGTGKTHLAVCALSALRARRIRGHFVSTRELLLECRDSFRKGQDGPGEILSRHTTADALLVDDLGAENSTQSSRGNHRNDRRSHLQELRCSNRHK